MRRSGLSFATVAALLMLVGSSPGVRAATVVGQPAPALAVAAFDGQPFDLGALRGKVVVVNYWATWCPPCREEMPALDAFYRQYHARGVEMIGLSADRPRDRDAARKMMQSYGYPAAMMRDAKPNGFGAPESLPVTYVIDAEGVVRAKLEPDQTIVTEKSLADLVLPLLPAQPPKAPVQ
jgi:peroxiredoxin